MPTLLDYIFGFFQNYQANVQDPDNASSNAIRFWPRKLNYTNGSCDDEENENEHNSLTVCDDDEDEEDNQEDQCEFGEFRGDDEGEGEECPCEPSRFARKMKLVSRAARYGMKEGALCGVFFGGGWGIYKWIDANYLGNKGGGKGGNNESGNDEGGNDEGGNDEGGEDNGSTTNANHMYVTAINSAIAMGLVCTFICCTKALVYCS